MERHCVDSSSLDNFFPQIFRHLSHDPASSECLDLLREYLVGKVSDHILICLGNVQKSPQRKTCWYFINVSSVLIGALGFGVRASGIEHRATQNSHHSPNVYFQVTFSLPQPSSLCKTWAAACCYYSDHQHDRLIARLQSKNRPFYSCVLRYLAFEWKWGWSWPCFDTNLTTFLMLITTN